MNNEEFARLHQKFINEEFKSIGIGDMREVTWDQLDSKVQEALLNTAGRMLEQVEAPVKKKLEDVVGTVESPKIVVSVEYTDDEDFDAVRLIEGALNTLYTVTDQKRVLNYVIERMNRSVNVAQQEVNKHASL